jgi:ribosome biogenesis GTPase / thiamine phosphate phosphatase
VHLSNLGWSAFFDQQLTADDRDWTPARVIWEGRGEYLLSSAAEDWRAQLTGRLRHRAVSRAELPTVGDWVLASGPRIHRVLARRSAFSRKSAGRASDQQVVAANIDTVLLVTSLNRDFNIRRLERYLALTWESGATPIIVLNKADVCADADLQQYASAASETGVRAVVSSVVNGAGMPELSEIVRHGGTTAMLGSSGVGKSSIVNALLGESRQSVREIRSSDHRGRHGTTSRQLIQLPGGGVVVDTPGMRELTLWDAEDGLEHAFADIEDLAATCRFRDCAHSGEPDCAVTAAVEGGSLDAARLESYRRLLREERFLRDRHQANSERDRLGRQLSKAIRQTYQMKGKKRG